MIASRTQDIFLTGGTGSLGHYLLVELMRASHVRCRVLLRPPLSAGRDVLAGLLADVGVCLADLMSAGRVTLVEGALPDHLDPAWLEDMDQVIHAAANTSFDADDRGEPAWTNVEGTRVLLEAVDRAGVDRFLFVSTAYVCGRTRGTVPETLLADAPCFNNAYERSKWQAEQRVWAWADGRKTATICRPSILVGDRATGRTTRMGGMYLAARATEVLARAVETDAATDRHRVPLRIAGRPEATLNIVPVCWVARRIASIALDPRQHGYVHHVTNPKPSTHAQIKAWLEEYFDVAGGTFADLAWPWPDASPYEEAFHSVGGPVLDYFRRDLRFESRLNDIEPPEDGLVDREQFLRCVRYAQETNWGRRRPHRGPRIAADASIDPRWYFEQYMPERLPDSQVARVEALTTVLRFVVEDPRGGEWVCRFDRGRLVELHRGSNGLAEEFGYRVTYEGFRDIVTGRRSVQAVFFAGQADIFGNTLMAMKMAPIVSAFIGESPVTRQTARAGR